MSGPQTEIYEFFCFIPGVNSLFEIEIEKDKSVDKLKQRIKKRKAALFANIDDDMLTLYRIEVTCPDQDERLNLLIQKAQKLTRPLDPMLTMSQVWKDGAPQKGTVHIMARLPSGAVFGMPHFYVATLYDFADNHAVNHFGLKNRTNDVGLVWLVFVDCIFSGCNKGGCRNI
jgi:CRISPR/Cas system-associated endoribonuclease Cas2